MGKILRFYGSPALKHYTDGHIELFPGGFAKIPDEVSEEDALAKVKDFGEGTFVIEDDGLGKATRTVETPGTTRIVDKPKAKRGDEAK
jgi:hypothetical protein